MIDDPAIHAVATKVRSLIGGARQNYARKLYAAGVELLLVADTDGAISAIAADICISETALYAYMRLPKAWSAPDFQQMTTKLTKWGMPLSASHFITLSTSKDKKRRSNLFKACLREGWTVTQLRQELSPYTHGLTDATKDQLKEILVTKVGTAVLSALYEAVKERATLKQVVSFMAEELKGS